MKVKRYANREENTVCIYFLALFDLVFSRDYEKSVNAALDYGFALLLSFVDREMSNPRDSVDLAGDQAIKSAAKATRRSGNCRSRDI